MCVSIGVSPEKTLHAFFPLHPLRRKGFAPLHQRYNLA